MWIDETRQDGQIMTWPADHTPSNGHIGYNRSGGEERGKKEENES